MEDDLDVNAPGYHGANAAMEHYLNDTAEAFDNLVNATAANLTMMSEIMATNKTLLDQMTQKDQIIADKDKEIARLNQRLQTTETGSAPLSSPRRLAPSADSTTPTIAGVADGTLRRPTPHRLVVATANRATRRKQPAPIP
jgi:hypothetical protein